MTVLSTDNRKRSNAIPFRALWYDNSNLGNQFNSDGTVSGDLSVLKTNNGIGGQIRMCRPLKGDLVEARLTMQATTPVTSPTSLRFYIGTFAADGITANTSYTEEYKAAQHKLITGYTSAISYGSQANVFIDGLNLLPAIELADATFGKNTDGWILGVELITKTGGSDWYLYQFKVDCTVLLAEVRA